jgi:hypothetical protein
LKKVHATSFDDDGMVAVEAGTPSFSSGVLHGNLFRRIHFSIQANKKAADMQKTAPA